MRHRPETVELAAAIARHPAGKKKEPSP